MTQKSFIRRDWISKSLAGFIGGGLIAIGSTGILDFLCADLPISIRGQIVMWLLPPIWLGVMSSVYFFRSGSKAWSWLGSAGLVCCLTGVALPAI